MFFFFFLNAGSSCDMVEPMVDLIVIDRFVVFKDPLPEKSAEARFRGAYGACLYQVLK